MNTSKKSKTSKEDLMKRWEKLVAQYKKAKTSPTVKCLVKLLVNAGKIIFSILMKKIIEILFKGL